MCTVIYRKIHSSAVYTPTQSTLINQFFSKRYFLLYQFLTNIIIVWRINNNLDTTVTGWIKNCKPEICGGLVFNRSHNHMRDSSVTSIAKENVFIYLFIWTPPSSGWLFAGQKRSPMLPYKTWSFHNTLNCLFKR